MYANLKVRYRNDEGGEEEVCAWIVGRDADVLVIGLDDPEDESDYACPDGEVRIAPADLLGVEANF